MTAARVGPELITTRVSGVGPNRHAIDVEVGHSNSDTGPELESRAQLSIALVRVQPALPPVLDGCI